MIISNLQVNKLGMRPTWDEYLMAQAIQISSKSSCRNVRAGSVIVNNENRIIGTGYNGAPTQIPSCYNPGCAKEKKGLEYELSLNSGECVGIHAEKNALGHLVATNAGKKTLYTTIFPCHTCAKDMLPYGITRIVFKSIYSKKEIDSTWELLEKACVKVERLDLDFKRYLDIIFTPNLPFKRKFDIWTKEEQEIIRDVLKK